MVPLDFKHALSFCNAAASFKSLLVPVIAFVSVNERETDMALLMTTMAFENGGAIPKEFTCDGEDVSPALAWTEPPAGTKCLTIIMDDPDAPAGTWVHWILYDLPPATRELGKGVAKDRQFSNGARQGRNDFGKIGYNGPCPPRGRPHRYFIKLYALDVKTNLKAGATKSDVERAMKGHILAQAEVVGHFQH
jgi:Raf kinase inhibitor-like YbhB/YbcL family protein